MTSISSFSSSKETSLVIADKLSSDQFVEKFFHISSFFIKGISTESIPNKELPLRIKGKIAVGITPKYLKIIEAIDNKSVTTKVDVKSGIARYKLRNF